MTSLGFENYSEALKIYLSRYREVSSPLSPLFQCSALLLREHIGMGTVF